MQATNSLRLFICPVDQMEPIATKADLSDDGDGDKIPPVDEEEETYQRSTC